MKTNQSTFQLPYPLLLAAMMASGVANAAPSSATPAVIGHLPVASNVTIAPAAPKAGETVTVTWSYTDADMDDQSGSTIEWLLAGSVVAGQTGTSFALPSDAASKSLQVRITPRSAAPADPAQGNPVTSDSFLIASSVPVACTPGTTLTANGKTFTCPLPQRLDWPGADSYCKRLTPAASLPTPAELQDLFVSSTSASGIDQINYEMCDIHGWPLNGGRCGGSTVRYWTSEANTSDYHYVVNMNDGRTNSNYDLSVNAHVTCVR